jgi:adenosylcobinamide kinase/adenosylcobinamide-phosphate guanylyltransferase
MERKNSMLVTITGGARSGKSSFAERYAAHVGPEGIYIATAQLYDDEMRDRAAQHRRDRETSGFSWTTVEEPYELAALLRAADREWGEDKVVVVDCMTLWLSNWMLRCEEDGNGQKMAEKIDELVSSLRNAAGTVLLVTNEVGGGLVPEYPLGRLFRDLAGRLNQQLAAVSDRVFLVTAGIPVELKSQAYRWDAP